MEIKKTDTNLPSTASSSNRPEKKEKDVLTERTKDDSREKGISENYRSLQMVEPVRYKAFFALDENKNVVIKVMDKEGKLVRQIPPEDYLRMVESMKENMENFLNMKA